MCDFIIAYEGEIPGAAPEQCGNYSEQNMAMAKYYIKKYKKELTENKRFEKPFFRRNFVFKVELRIIHVFLAWKDAGVVLRFEENDFCTIIKLMINKNLSHIFTLPMF